MINHFASLAAARAHLTAKGFTEYRTRWINSDNDIIAQIFTDPHRGVYIHFVAAWH